MLGFDVRLEVGRIGRLVVTVETGVRFLARVRAHVFLQLRGMSETFPTFHTNVRETFTVNGQQVAVE